MAMGGPSITYKLHAGLEFRSIYSQRLFAQSFLHCVRGAQSTPLYSLFLFCKICVLVFVPFVTSLQLHPYLPLKKALSEAPEQPKALYRRAKALVALKEHQDGATRDVKILGKTQSNS